MAHHNADAENDNNINSEKFIYKYEKSNKNFNNDNNSNIITYEQKIGIKEFYEGAIIFITGATGFLGKALIEKLLRSCDGVQMIYILVRSKRGLSSEQRYKEFIKHQAFDRLRIEKPQSIEKIKCLPGDIRLPNLGLSDDDLQAILDNVDIVFHSGATVKFNEGLKEAAELNTCGTQKLMDLCCKMSNLKSVVHVSTAYCNPGRKYVKEMVYPPTPPMNKDSFIKCVNILPKEILNAVTNEIQGSHPNTYTLTKSIAEQIVSEYSYLFPVSIIRPSIITAAIEEPYPGWVDNIQGITGIMMEIGRGTISSILGDENLVCDIIPVDTVVNTMIGAAWTSGIRSYPSLQVYNCTSGQIKPITWKNLGLYTLKWARINPSKYVMLYPKFGYRTNEFMHAIYEILFHFLPAFIFDLVMKFRGSKPIMMKIAKKFKSACHTGKFFALHEWIFDNKNQEQLCNDIQNDSDGREFDCNIRNLDYDDYIRNYMLGIRKFVLKDGEESFERARRKLSNLYWFRKIFQVVFLSLITYAIANRLILN